MRHRDLVAACWLPRAVAVLAGSPALRLSMSRKISETGERKRLARQLLGEKLLEVPPVETARGVVLDHQLAHREQPQRVAHRGSRQLDQTGRCGSTDSSAFGLVHRERSAAARRPSARPVRCTGTDDRPPAAGCRPASPRSARRAGPERPWTRRSRPRTVRRRRFGIDSGQRALKRGSSRSGSRPTIGTRARRSSAPSRVPRQNPPPRPQNQDRCRAAPRSRSGMSSSR